MTRQHRRIVICAALVFLLFASGALSLWFPWRHALRIAVSIPFILVIPGWIVLSAHPAAPRDRIEWIMGAVVFSIISNTSALYVVEQFSARVTDLDVIVTVAMVHGGALGARALLVYRQRNRQRSGTSAVQTRVRARRTPIRAQ